MKNILVSVALVFSCVLVAQNQMTEGMAVSTQKMSSDNEQVNGQLAMMGNMETTTYFKNNKSRSELSNPMSGDVTTIIDSDAKQMIMLMNNPMIGKKYLITPIDPSDEDMKNFTIQKGELTKTILGYECQQYFATFKKDGQEMKMEMFTTEKIPVMTQNTTMFVDQLKGFPLYSKLEMNQMGTNMTIETEVIEIKKEDVADSKFDMTPPEGYEKMEQ